MTGIAAGAYTTLNRTYCYKFLNMVWFSSAIVISEMLTSANNLAVSLPKANAATDVMVTTAAGNSYAAFVSSSGTLVPNTNMPAGTYFTNFVYYARS